MTRWARAGSSQKHKKMPGEGTSWEELSKGIRNKVNDKTSLKRVNKPRRKHNIKKKKRNHSVCENSLAVSEELRSTLEYQEKSKKMKCKKMVFSPDTLSAADFKPELGKKRNYHEGFDHEEINSEILLNINDHSEKESEQENNLKKSKLQKTSKKPCFNCRQRGHTFEECPARSTDLKQVTGICFKCGSTEHTSYRCRSKIKNFPFAKCFVCKEQGHISKDCPKNAHGVYIKGGSCRLCGNVNHFMKDCPTQKKQGEVPLTLPVFTSKISADTEIGEDMQNIKENRDKVKKVVKFL